MNNFWNIVGFECKKIITVRNIIILLILLFFISLSAVGILIGNVYVDGEISDSKYNSFMIDKNNSLALAGKVLDEELLGQVVLAYSNYPADSGIEEQRQAYQTYIRPYLDVQSIITGVYGVYDYTEIGAITNEEIENFYSLREEAIARYIDSIPINENSKAMLTSMSSEIEAPIVMGYADSYMLSMTMMDSSSLLLSFLIAFIFAGLFSREYQTGIISLQLTSKNGKKTLFAAKLFTFICISSFIILCTLAVNYISCMVAYGPQGANTALQNHLIHSPYPFTVSEAMVIDYIVIFCASLFFGVLIVWLSSQIKSPFIVLAIGITVLLIPIFVPIPETLPTLYRLMGLFPSNAFLYLNNFSVLVYELFFISAPPYIFVPIFHVITAAVLIFFSYRIYKKHQVF